MHICTAFMPLSTPTSSKTTSSSSSVLSPAAIVFPPFWLFVHCLCAPYGVFQILCHIGLSSNPSDDVCGPRAELLCVSYVSRSTYGFVLLPLASPASIYTFPMSCGIRFHFIWGIKLEKYSQIQQHAFRFFFFLWHPKANREPGAGITTAEQCHRAAAAVCAMWSFRWSSYVIALLTSPDQILLPLMSVTWWHGVRIETMLNAGSWLVVWMVQLLWWCWWSQENFANG